MDYFLSWSNLSCLQIIFSLVIVRFVRVDLLYETWKTVVSLRQDTEEASTSYILDAHSLVFLPHSLLNAGRFLFEGCHLDGFLISREIDLSCFWLLRTI